MVVLASHSSPTRTRLRFCATKPWRSNSGRATSLASVVRCLAPRARASFVSASTSPPPAPRRANSGSTIEHVDLVGALEARKARDRAVDHRDQRERAREPGAEGVFVVGGRGPGLALGLVVVLGRQLLDAGAKDLGAAPNVGGDIGAQTRRRSSFRLPGRRAVLVVLDGDAERGKLVAQPVGLSPIPGRRAPPRERPRLRRFLAASTSASLPRSTRDAGPRLSQKTQQIARCS